MACEVAGSLQKTKEFDSDDAFLARIKQLDADLLKHFAEAFLVDESLTRKLVSFQANKSRAHYRWYKYKEAFSADLVEYLFRRYDVRKGKILDPFAGAGTALFACSALGYEADGVELLPVGQKIIEANMIARGEHKRDIIEGLDRWVRDKKWNTDGETRDFEILRITEGAYSEETHRKIKRYLNDLQCEETHLRDILLFAALCVLESISYTRKDGQYLRWDYRSGRRRGKSTFDKGKIHSFDEAIQGKLEEIRKDIAHGGDDRDLFACLTEDVQMGNVALLKGSCLEILPKLKARTYTGLITSPPYCNRYDYTRTYALEHALLGINEDRLLGLRQAMLSCTVENKEKELLSLNDKWAPAVDACNRVPLLQETLAYLDYKKKKGELNNSGIARMVRGYFYEMACVMQECYRVLIKGGVMFMVNDNVRYAGAPISVDTVMSMIAEDLGFKVENILVLPRGKGNSSQQMGKHGREALRKCVYVWRKNK